MSYFDVYKARVTALGGNPQEKAFNSGKLEFKRYLKYSEHTVRNLINERTGFFFDCVILTNKQDESQTTLQLLVELDKDLKVGDLLIWDQEHWIIYKKDISSYQPYNKFLIIKCNYLIKWVENGEIYSTYSYICSSKDSQIKDNFRTWHNVITPQPNKYLEIICPTQNIPRDTEIIVDEEAWYLVDYDKISVPGIIYLSFTETNVNQERDDIDDSIANADQINKWKISGSDTLVAKLGDTIEPQITIYKNGLVTNEVTIKDLHIDTNGDIIYQDEKLIINGAGKVIYTYKNAIFEQKIEIQEQEQPSIYIIGNDLIRVSETSQYVLYGAQECSFSIDNTKLARVKKINNNTCEIITNEENNLGKIILTAIADEKTYSKEITIISIWQVI